MNPLRKVWLVALVATCFVVVGAVWAKLDTSASSTDLAAWVPQGALLSLETQDFAKILEDWTSSSENTAWLKSDDYAVFSRSRLFGRLQDAQKEFADAAGLPVDEDFLKEMAGRQSFFAWYDIGELQIVYITRMTPAQLEHGRLWQRRKDFETRQAGGVTFYVKSGDDSDRDAASSRADTQATSDASSDTETDGDAAVEKKTVAFAESGDWLVLSTNEDLMAQTLESMAGKGGEKDDSLAQQGWYKEAKAKASGSPGDLRMVLDMEKVVKTPQFRTYWVQQNVTEMKQYKAVVSDLYRSADGMREDRALLPESESASTTTDVDLGQMVALVPDHTVIFRATAKPTAGDAVQALQSKVLERGVGSYEDASVAPTANLETPPAGSVTDLETRIDEPIGVTIAKPGSVTSLAAIMQGMTLEGMMTVDRNSAGGKRDGIWTPFASAVLLLGEKDWDVHVLQDAIRHSVETKLTVGSLGTEWQQKTTRGANYFAMNDAHGLELYVSGHICIVADDTELLLAMIQKQQQAKSAKPEPAMMLAGFDHSAARDGFAQWTTVVDGLSHMDVGMIDAGSMAAAASQAPGEAPPFFGKDMKGLSDAFIAMSGERFIAWHDGTLVRQTVTYTWQR